MYRITLGLSLFAASLIATGLAHGEYPTKPVRFIVPFPPGGLADLVGRIVGELVRTQLEAWRRAVREAGIPQE